jgi:hypothetical protein
MDGVVLLPMLSAAHLEGAHMYSLTEIEREALDGWMSRDAQLLAVARGRSTADGQPVWLLMSTGLMVVQFSATGGQVRAHVQWTPPYSLYRLDLIDEAHHALLRMVTHHRRHVLLAVSTAEARVFATEVRALIQRTSRAPVRTQSLAGVA